MNFWAFANNHPYVTLFCVLGVASCVASCVKYISRIWTGKSKLPKIETKAPRHAAEKAH